MEIVTQDIPGLLLLKPRVFPDMRGVFFESFNRKSIDNLSKEADEVRMTKFVQDNLATNVKKNVIRGLHFQKTKLQAKLVTCQMGSILDVVVDFRRESPTFGKSLTFLLDDKNFEQLFIPRGLAHGYRTLEDYCIVSYKADNYYDAADYKGVIWNDCDLDIDWGISENVVISDQDLGWGSFSDFVDSDIIF